MRDLAGFGVVAKPMGRFCYITGMPGQAPVRPGISIGDSLPALHRMIGILLTLYHRVTMDGRG
jgi:formyl-CoA transferase